MAGSRDFGRRPLEQQRRGADRQREEQQAAQAERERERRAAREEVVGGCAQRRARPAVAGRHHVAVEVHRALRLARRARGERDERRVVGRRVDVGERRRLARGQRVEAVGSHPCRTWPPSRASGSPDARDLELGGEAVVAERVRDPRLGDDVGELLGAQQRHRAHRDAARLQHREPARRVHRAVRRAQQHAIAGDEAEILDQHARDAVGVAPEARRTSSAARPARRWRGGLPSRARPRGRAASSRSSCARDTGAPAAGTGTPATAPAAAGCPGQTCRHAPCNAWPLPFSAAGARARRSSFCTSVAPS